MVHDFAINACIRTYGHISCSRRAYYLIEIEAWTQGTKHLQWTKLLTCSEAINKDRCRSVDKNIKTTPKKRIRGNQLLILHYSYRRGFVHAEVQALDELSDYTIAHIPLSLSNKNEKLVSWEHKRWKSSNTSSLDQMETVDAVAAAAGPGPGLTSAAGGRRHFITTKPIDWIRFFIRSPSNLSPTFQTIDRQHSEAIIHLTIPTAREPCKASQSRVTYW